MSAFRPEDMISNYDAMMKNGDCSFLGELLASLKNETDKSRRIAILHVLKNAVQHTNTNLALSEDVYSALQSDEAGAVDAMIAKLKALSTRSSISKHPGFLFEYEDIRKFSGTYFKRKSQPFITKNSKILTLGSCFAGNVATHLKRLGYNAESYGLGELANNSFTNRALVESLTNEGAFNDFFDERVKRLSPDIYDSMLSFRENAVAADVFIFTLGLSYAFYHNDGAPLRKPAFSYNRGTFAGLSFKPIDINDNVINIVSITQAIKNVSPQAKIVFTLSPVPLDGILSNEESVVEVDCISKSIGRASLAVAEEKIKSEGIEFIYFPSFEIVRWVGCNQEYPLFGGTDGTARHVTADVIEAVMEVFCEFYVSDYERP